MPVPMLVAVHRSELQHLEFSSIETDPLLSIEDRAARRKSHRERDQGEQWREQDDQQRRDHLIERVLHRELPAAWIARLRSKQRYPTQVLDLDPTADLLEQTRNG